MNREIKFRAIYKGCMVYGNLIQGTYDGKPFTQIERSDSHDFAQYEVEGSTVGQFTGLKDKNGKEIYEADIIRLSDGDVSHHRIFWDIKSGRWMDERLEDGDSLTGYDDFSFVSDCEIVGNIYENPELIDASTLK